MDVHTAPGSRLGVRFAEALTLAFDLHAKQERKGSGVPYIAHLLAVTALVLENGGDEDQAIGALLHDAVEDQGGYQTLDLIQNRFGPRVAEIVRECSDAFSLPKPPWRVRKQAYLAHLEHANQDVLLVSLADKVHNARSILEDLRRDGELVWERFTGGKQGTLWYYRQLSSVFRGRAHPQLLLEYERALAEIEYLVEQGSR